MSRVSYNFCNNCGKTGHFTNKCKNLNDDEIENLVNIISLDINKRISEVYDLKYMPTTEPYLNQERLLSMLELIV